MFEKAVAKVLQQVLGAFVKGIDAESLKLSVWDGDIRLTNLELDIEAVEGLGLPIRVRGGSVGEVRVEVPWRNLSTKPIVVSVQQLYVLVAPKDDTGVWDEEVEERRKLQAKREQLEVWEAMESEKGTWDAMGERVVGQLVQDLLRKLVLKVSNVHVRLESGEGETIAAGVTLSQLSVSNVSKLEAQKKEKGAKAQPLRKLISIEGLGIYVSPAEPVPIRHGLLAPDSSAKWEAVMGPMLREEASPMHLVRPISLQLDAWINPSASNLGEPQLKLHVVLPETLWLSLQQPQLVVLIKLAEDVGRTERIDRLRRFGRPEALPSVSGARVWWTYAKKATMVLHRSSGVHLSWSSLFERREKRLGYVNAYIDALAASGQKKAELKQDLAALEDVLELEDILRYRRLARASANASAGVEAKNTRCGRSEI